MDVKERKIILSEKNEEVKVITKKAIEKRTEESSYF